MNNTYHKYFEALNKSGKLIEAFFEQSQEILHSATKGTIRETIIKKIIRPYLPDCYGLSGGECFDSCGKTSKQMDLIIYDKLFSYIVPYMDNFIQFPCESVYGNIEIKSKLDKKELISSLGNIASLKALQRESTQSWDVTPLSRISLNGKPSGEKHNHLWGIIFAYQSVEVNTILDYFINFNDILAKTEVEQVLIDEIGNINKHLLPNAIVLFDKKTILLPCNRDRIFTNNLGDLSFWGYEAINCKDKLPAIFLGLLQQFLRVTKLFSGQVFLDCINGFFADCIDDQYTLNNNETRKRNVATFNAKR